MKPLILAVDFDGTIIKNEKDYIPRTLLSNAKEVINWAHKKGCYIIIWTCRTGDMLKPMIDFLKKHNVEYDTINENYSKVNFETSRKVYADYYIDDRSFYIDWTNIKKEIANKMIKLMAEDIEELSKESK